MRGERFESGGHDPIYAESRGLYRRQGRSDFRYRNPPFENGLMPGSIRPVRATGQTAKSGPLRSLGDPGHTGACVETVYLHPGFYDWIDQLSIVPGVGSGRLELDQLGPIYQPAKSS